MILYFDIQEIWRNVMHLSKHLGVIELNYFLNVNMHFSNQ